MLARLFVQNYALIKELDVEFENGLIIITGETGAGKSILLGALSLILGSRADTTVLLDKNEKCIVEGTFRIDEYDLKDFFPANELDYEPMTILRREINQSGKSRAFINDTPVTLNLLKELGDHLIDIHSQHQTLMLNDNSFQMNIIDSFAGTARLKGDYSRSFSKFQGLKKELENLKEETYKKRSDLEYYQFQYDQLEKARLRNGEQQELEAEQEILEHSGEIRSALTHSSQLFNEEEKSILSMLSAVKASLQKIASFLPNGEELLKRSESSLIELTDLARDIDNLSLTIESDPGRLASITERLDLLYSLMHKHKLDTLDDLIRRQEELGGLIASIGDNEERLAELEINIQQETERLRHLAEELSGMRKSVLKGIESTVTDLLMQLGMPNAKFRVSLSRTPDFMAAGIDHADFLFSANKQVQPENLAKVASGGELSRVMLSLKSLLTKNKNLPTIIFDEIDAGVSGEVADKVGQILSGMGKYMQVINITHLPQVASRGTRHYHVYKDDTADSTFTRVKLLSPDERVLEVARLLSGSEVTETAIKNARELLTAAIN